MGGRRLRFNNRIDFKQILRKRYIASSIVGLFSAFLFYAFLQLFFELLRFMDVQFMYNHSLTVSPVLRFKIHLLLAGIAVLLGHGIFLGFLFKDVQSKYLTPRHGSRIKGKILNEQWFMIPNFIYFFFKVTFVISSTLLLYFEDGKFKFLFLFAFLAFLIFFLESIKTINQYLGKWRFVIIPSYFLLLIVLSFGLSKISFANYSKIEQGYLTIHPYADLPELDFEVIPDKEYGWRPISRIKIIGKDEKCKFYYGIIFPKGQFSQILQDITLNQSRPEYRNDLHVYVDENISMECVEKFEEACLNYNLHTVYYHYKQDEWNNHLNRNAIRKSITLPKDYNRRFPLQPPLPEYFFNRYNDLNEIKISFYEGVLQVDGNMLEKSKVYNFFKTHISQKTLFNFNYNEDLKFQSYIEILALYQKALFDLRRERNTLELPMNGRITVKWKDEIRRLRELYPHHWVENY